MKRDAWRQGSPEEQARSPGADEKHRGSRWKQSVRWLLPRASPAKLASCGLRYCGTAATVQKESALPRSQEFKVITTKVAPCGPAIPRAIKGAQPSAPDLARLRSAFFGGRAPSRIVRCLFRVLVGCGASGDGCAPWPARSIG